MATLGGRPARVRARARRRDDQPPRRARTKPRRSWSAGLKPKPQLVTSESLAPGRKPSEALAEIAKIAATPRGPSRLGWSATNPISASWRRGCSAPRAPSSSRRARSAASTSTGRCRAGPAPCAGCCRRVRCGASLREARAGRHQSHFGAGRGGGGIAAEVDAARAALAPRRLRRHGRGHHRPGPCFGGGAARRARRRRRAGRRLGWRRHDERGGARARLRDRCRWRSCRPAQATAWPATWACRGIRAAALAAATAGRPWRIDAGEVNGELFFNVAGLGLDARIAHAFAANRGRRGLLALPADRRCGSWCATRRASTTLPGTAATGRRRRLFIALANSRQYGGHGCIAPRAVLDDGRLDLVIVDDLPLWRVLAAPAGVLSRHPATGSRAGDGAVHPVARSPRPAVGTPPRRRAARRERRPRRAGCTRGR